MRRSIKILVFSSLLLSGILLVAQAQVKICKTKIPISLNQIGIPILVDDYGYHLEGFEVDSSENYYFLTGNNNHSSYLIKYQNDTELYRRKYSEIVPSRLYLSNDTIITFNNQMYHNSLFFLNSRIGCLLEVKKNVLEGRVNAYAFYKGKLILETFDPNANTPLNTGLSYIEMDFNGKILNFIGHDYGLLGGGHHLPFDMSAEWASPMYIGDWNGNLLFYVFDVVTFNSVFVLYHPGKKITTTHSFTQKDFGDQFYDPWLELVKLRNESLYIVSHNTDQIIINKIKMKDLFPSPE